MKYNAGNRVYSFPLYCTNLPIYVEAPPEQPVIDPAKMVIYTNEGIPITLVQHTVLNNISMLLRATDLAPVLKALNMQIDNAYAELGTSENVTTWMTVSENLNNAILSFINSYDVDPDMTMEAFKNAVATCGFELIASDNVHGSPSQHIFPHDISFRIVADNSVEIGPINSGAIECNDVLEMISRDAHANLSAEITVNDAGQAELTITTSDTDTRELINIAQYELLNAWMAIRASDDVHGSPSQHIFPDEISFSLNSKNDVEVGPIDHFAELTEAVMDMVSNAVVQNGMSAYMSTNNLGQSIMVLRPANDVDPENAVEVAKSVVMNAWMRLTAQEDAEISPGIRTLPTPTEMSISVNDELMLGPVNIMAQNLNALMKACAEDGAANVRFQIGFFRTQTGTINIMLRAVDELDVLRGMPVVIGTLDPKTIGELDGNPMPDYTTVYGNVDPDDPNNT